MARQMMMMMIGVSSAEKSYSYGGSNETQSVSIERQSLTIRPTFGDDDAGNNRETFPFFWAPKSRLLGGAPFEKKTQSSTRFWFC